MRQGFTMSTFLIQTLNGLTFASVLFLMAAGFTLIFGLMSIPNMAHGALFMLGGYLCVTLVDAELPFALAALGSAMVVGILGIALERAILRRLAHNELAQVLATLGMAFVIADSCKTVWGGMPLEVAVPPLLMGAVSLGELIFPLYRLFVMALAVVTAVALDLSLSRTLLGARLRAAVEDRTMARAVGIRVDRLFMTIFFVGAALVGIGGAMGAPILSVFPGLDMEVLPLVLIVVVLGGTGSIPGAMLGSLITGLVHSFGQSVVPEMSYVLLFVPMIVVLAYRPQGLFGRVAA
jgi:branched-chain amino acid transport system permease protein